MIAVSFALGVVEPEASGLGGDGTAVLYLRAWPSRRSSNTRIRRRSTPRSTTRPSCATAGSSADGPAAANIPGVVAGLDYLYSPLRQRQGDLGRADRAGDRARRRGLRPRRGAADEHRRGPALPREVPEAARIFLPGGHVPQPGDRFVNKDYAATLRAIAKDGAETFYRGEIAKKIAADMAANGGIITYADLAQYRAMERKPVAGRYRGHALYAGGPPVSTGIQLYRVAADSRATTRRRPRRHGHDRRRLLPSRDRGVEGARSAAPRRRSRALAGRLRRAPAADHAARAVPADRSGARPRRFERQADDDGRFAPPATRIGTRHDVVRGRRRRGQHDCRHADAQHLGRHLLRVEGPRLPLQQPPAQRRAPRPAPTAAWCR